MPRIQLGYANGLRASSVFLLFVGLIGAASVPAKAQHLPEIFKRVDSSVVVVLTKERQVPPLADARPVNVAGFGSGVLVSDDGKVLTAAHLVQTADTIMIEFLTGEVLAARVVSSEPAADLALLQLERAPRAPAPARLGDSDAVKVGDEVFVVGAPLGMSHTLTVGYISARRMPNDIFSDVSLAEFFQTDAAINQGNSGGPLFNLAGEVIGIVSRIVSQSGGSDGLGFAVTSKVARLVLEERSFWSGLSGLLVSGDLAQVLNLPPPGVGLLVQRIARGSPAERIGLRAGTIRARIDDEDLILGGDIILAVQGVPLAGQEEYLLMRRKVRELRPGEPITVTVLRAGKKRHLTGTVEP